ncbi:hypothetical protein CDB3_21920 [Bacillus sp. CDB3]|nr:hypothetical protein CDB3_21920 [Bacillus sp. CDB3]
MILKQNGGESTRYGWYKGYKAHVCSTPEPKKVKEIEASHDYNTIEKQAKKLAKETIVENTK